MQNKASTSNDLKVKHQIDLQGLDCASCVNRIESRLKKLNGVDEARVSFMLNRLYVVLDPTKISISQIESSIERLGYKIKQKKYESKLHKILNKLEILIKG